MMRALWIPAALLVVTSTVITGSATGCATATGEITGGEARFDASESLSTVEVDGGPMAAGHSWTELYGDFFGNPRAACSGNGTCHGDENQAGAQDSNFVCPLNDKDDCYTSITSPLAALISSSSPDKSALTNSVLRHADANIGNMPKSPPYAFSAADLARIQAWIDEGAPNDSPAPVDAGADSGTDDLDAGDASD